MLDYVVIGDMLDKIGSWGVVAVLLFERIMITPKFTSAIEKLTMLIDERMPKQG